MVALYSSFTGVFLSFEMFLKSPDNLSHKNSPLSWFCEKENKTGATWDYSDRHEIAMTTRLAMSVRLVREQFERGESNPRCINLLNVFPSFT